MRILPASSDQVVSARAGDVRARVFDLGYRVSKRSLDLLVAGTGVVLLVPVLLAIAIAVRLTSPGPAIFRQRRTGLASQEFTMWKFRTMRVDADQAVHQAFVAGLMGAPRPDAGADTVYKLVDDPRVTPVGRFLRRTSLDELPQLFHVLSGRMSLVGPRPGIAYEMDLYQPEHHRRFAAKPGITGLWQVSGRNALTFRQALDLDVDYVRRRSLGFDLRILLRTVPIVLGRRGVA